MRTKTKGFKALSSFVVASLLLSACASGGGSSANMTTEERQMREQAAVFNQTVAEGAAVGCLAGSLVGLLTSSKGSRAESILTGCAVGGVLGGVTGYAVADAQEGYAKEEIRLDQMAADIRKDNERIANLIQSSNKVIAADKSKIADLEKKIAVGSISREQAKTELAGIDSNIAYLKETIGNLNGRKQEYASARDAAAKQGQTSVEADKEIATLTKQIAGLQTQVDSLVQRRKVSRVG